jgi:hypothetical protein
MDGERTDDSGFVVYSRADCHLCDVMLEELRVLLDGREIGLSIVDISGRDELIRQYGERIPVLTADGAELCHYRLDTRRVKDWLSA